MICPIMSHDLIHHCAKVNCGLWDDENHVCLVAMALKTYVNKENQHSEKVENFKQQMDLSPWGFMTFQEKHRDE